MSVQWASIHWKKADSFFLILKIKFWWKWNSGIFLSYFFFIFLYLFDFFIYLIFINLLISRSNKYNTVIISAIYIYVED